jgi:hypothetical protein
MRRAAERSRRDSPVRCGGSRRAALDAQDVNRVRNTGPAGFGLREKGNRSGWSRSFPRCWSRCRPLRRVDGRPAPPCARPPGYPGAGRRGRQPVRRSATVAARSSLYSRASRVPSRVGPVHHGRIERQHLHVHARLVHVRESGLGLVVVPGDGAVGSSPDHDGRVGPVLSEGGAVGRPVFLDGLQETPRYVVSMQVDDHGAWL